METTVDSKEWPTDRSGAESVKIKLPADEPSGDGGGGDPPVGPNSSSTSGELKADEIQNLADEVGELVSAAAGYGIRFNVDIEVGTDESPPDDVEARLNEILRRVSEDLQL
jgi:hypothetical protein